MIDINLVSYDKIKVKEVAESLLKKELSMFRGFLD
jgi:hypothetical protein